MRADTQVRPDKNSLTLALSQREREWRVIFIDHFEEMQTGDLKKTEKKIRMCRLTLFSLLSRKKPPEGGLT